MTGAARDASGPGPRLMDLVREHGGALFALHGAARDTGLIPLDDPRLAVRPADVHVHSGSVRGGDLFVALPGLASDGVRYAPDAIARGASAVLMSPERSVLELRARCAAQRQPGAVAWLHPRAREIAGAVASDVHGRPTRAIELAGVTGTNGKTSVCHVASQILDSSGRAPAVLGTAGHVIRSASGPLHLAARNTTPDACEVHRLLARHRAGGGDCGVMEVSSHGLVQARLAGVSLRVGAFTNLTRDHLDYHRTMERYFAAKARLWEHVEPGGSAVIVGRGGAADGMAAVAASRGLEITRVQIEADASGGDRDLVVRGLRAAAGGARFELHGMGFAGEAVRLPLRGAHNVENALVAAAIARCLGASPDAVLTGLGRVAAAPGRLEPVNAPDRGAGAPPFDVLVDYAHTPDALERVLGALRDEIESVALAGEGCARRRLICVFGCGGDRDRGKREPMGEVAGRLADVSIVTSDNPRGEAPAEIAAAVVRGVDRAGGRRFVELDRRAAIGRAVELARPGDVLLIAGKGHENLQVIGSSSLPFDDRVVAAEALAERATVGQGGKR